MNWFNRKRDDRIKALEEKVMELQKEVEFLRGASTMRVGEFSFYAFTDRRPVLTAMQAIQKLMADAGIEPKAVPAMTASVEFVQQAKEQQ